MSPTCAARWSLKNARLPERQRLLASVGTSDGFGIGILTGRQFGSFVGLVMGRHLRAVCRPPPNGTARRSRTTPAPWSAPGSPSSRGHPNGDRRARADNRTGAVPLTRTWPARDDLGIDHRAGRHIQYAHMLARRTAIHGDALGRDGDPGGLQLHLHGLALLDQHGPRQIRDRQRRAGADRGGAWPCRSPVPVAAPRPPAPRWIAGAPSGCRPGR